jgi:hypothetical protein
MMNSSTNHTNGHNLPDAHRDNGPAVAAVADAGGGPAMESSTGGEAKRMESVASRGTDRSRAIGKANGNDALAYGAETAGNEIINVDQSVQWRAAGAEEDVGQREKPAIIKGQRAFPHCPFRLVLLHRRSVIDMLAGH